MNKITCNMAQDLIPLYIDEALSEESKASVEQHIAECEDCKHIVEDMKSDVEAIKENTPENGEVFKKVQKGFRKNYLKKFILAVFVFLIVFVGVNVYVILHVSPVWPHFDPDMINDYLDVVMIDGNYYLHQTDLLATGELYLVNEEEGYEKGIVNIYLGEKGIHNLGLGRVWMIAEQYREITFANILEDEENVEVKQINYCQPDGTVVATLWEKGDELKALTEQENN